ncbi:MAG TPA: BlaI/MecI/CopY family transcriptional regulator [Terriglobales bacterium]|nr:BlaI/MecI/CopY family transcriptional regulator [Terriglobales bacterium]
MTPRHGGELPQLELDCVGVLWRQGEASAALIRGVLAERGRRLAHTTVLTVLQRLLRKQVIAARRVGRQYLFHALVSRQQMRAQAVERLVRNYFDSREELLEYLGAAAGARPGAAARPPAGADGAAGAFDASLL